METKEKDPKSQPKPSEENGSVYNTPVETSTAGHSTYVEEDEIDLADLIKQLWKRRKVVLVTTVAAFILGTFVSIFSPEEYSASIVLMPQSSSSTGNVASGLLRQFGGLAGLGVGGAETGTLNPSLYPEITQSTPFFLHMMEEDMYYTTLDTTLNFMKYFGEIQKPSLPDYLKMYTIGLPKLIIGFPAKLINSFKSKPRKAQSDKGKIQDSLTIYPTIDSISSVHESIQLTGKQLSVINKIKNRIETSIEANGTVKVSVEMPDPLVASRTTEMAVKYLTNYIQEYRTEKAQQDLFFIEKQYNKKKEKYDVAQQNLARFRDRNTNIFTESARVELDRLQTENNLAFNLYQSLAQQLEQAKIKVQEETPVFKVLEPIQVPLSSSKPKREMIITLSLFLGVFVGFSIAFLQIIYLNIKSKIL